MIRTLLIFLCGLTGIGALYGGYMLMFTDISEWGLDDLMLIETPFTFQQLGFLLFTLVGGANMGAVLLLIFGKPEPYLPLLAGAVNTIWILVQLYLLGYISWLQPVVLVAGLAIIALSLRLGKTG